MARQNHYSTLKWKDSPRILAGTNPNLTSSSNSCNSRDGDRSWPAGFTAGLTVSRIVLSRNLFCNSSMSTIRESRLQKLHLNIKNLFGKSTMTIFVNAFVQMHGSVMFSNSTYLFFFSNRSFFSLSLMHEPFLINMTSKSASEMWASGLGQTPFFDRWRHVQTLECT
jgi:hypothetical protein